MMMKFIRIFLLLTICISFSISLNAKTLKYDKCIKSADIGNYISNKKFDGIDFEKINVKKAKENCLKALKFFPNDIKILRSLGRIFYKNEEFKDAMKFYKKASQLGDAFSDWGMFNLFYYGEGVKKDYDKAFPYILRAANKNFIYALEKIGDLYVFGHGT